MNRKKVKRIMLCFGFMLISLVTYAEIKPPNPEEGGAPPPKGNELPIDGGLSLLLASGVAYGIYILKRKKE